MSNFSKKDTTCLDVETSRRFRFATGGFANLFLTRADWSALPESLRPVQPMDHFDCRGARCPDNPMKWPSNDHTFAMLDAEQRGLNMFIANQRS